MTPEQKKAIVYLRQHGLGYKAIGIKLSLSANSIKSFCRREAISLGGLESDTLPDYCHACGHILTHIKGKKKKRFCGTACRMAWWKEHQSEVKRKAYTDHSCKGCQKPFSSYGNPKRSYCSHLCYIKSRFGGKG